LKKFEIVYARSVQKDIKGLKVKRINHLHKTLQRLTNNPFPNIETGRIIKKLEIKEPTYRLRIGEYRIIYRVEIEKIIVLKIIYRKELEKELKRLSQELA